MAFGDNFAKLCRLPSAGISADVFSQSVFSFQISETTSCYNS